jgi:hypothetical protein
LQGRALPRSAEVLQDWARLLDTRRDAIWLASCALDDFAAALATRFGRDAEDLLASHAFAGRGTRTARPAAAAQPRMSGVRYLCGTYACYGIAWSPYSRGNLIRGSLVVAPGRREALVATYSEMLLGKPVRLSGEPTITRGSMHMALKEAGGEVPIYFSLLLPRPPASLLSGIMAGTTLVSPVPEPSASRIVMIRVAEGNSLDDTNRYFSPKPGAISDDLAGLGLQLGTPQAVDQLVHDFLIRNHDLEQVDTTLQLALTAELDPCHLKLAGEAVGGSLSPVLR